MKKMMYALVLLVLFSACKSKSATNTRLDNRTEVALKGNWTLTKVSYPGAEVIKITSFDLADSQCFVGSQWRFISNNNKGEFSLNNASCTAFTSPITWFVNKEGQFVMKILNETKARKVTEGYVLQVGTVTDATFELTDRVNVGGKTVTVVYQFSRN
ncbi:lipocalin family protein [Flavobacterium sp.]|jgi:hypothetical protein|uniref:lipocalin family protein n=1 Tax=Flavobacterium sp. TaxID=239 RepID=UPI0022CA2870|nr:lipocalin family protein [Flavobacterium sp.]MCZ8145732.1 lipocalin family protein [Flavobacterium sp.]MCZ8367373.1 lipocalin family protein [Flavobacterium sp.]